MNVPQLRFSGFDREWEEVNLGSISDITKLAGFEFTAHIKYSGEGKIIALRGLNVKNGRLNLDNVKYIDGSNFKKLSRSKLVKNDLLFTYVGTVGEVAIIDEEEKYYLAPNVSRIRVNRKKVDSLFLMTLISSRNFFQKVIYPLIATSSQPALSMENIRKFIIRMPSLEEQQRIATLFSLLNKKIEKQQEKIEKLEQFKKGMMQKIFSQELRFKDEDGGEFLEWETKSLIELGEFKRSYSFSRSYEGEGEYFHIHYGDIHTKLNSIIHNETELPNISVNGDLEELEVGDILFADASEDYKDLGKAVVIVGNQSKKVVAGLHTHRFKPSTLINPVYLMYFTKTNYYSSFIRMYGTGVSVLGISKNNLGTLEVPVPSTEEQVKIAEFLMIIDNKIKKEKEKLMVLEEQKRGFMQGMFV